VTRFSAWKKRLDRAISELFHDTAKTGQSINLRHCSRIRRLRHSN